jgi:hypothetical protein
MPLSHDQIRMIRMCDMHNERNLDANRTGKWIQRREREMTRDRENMMEAQRKEFSSVYKWATQPNNIRTC